MERTLTWGTMALSDDYVGGTQDGIGTGRNNTKLIVAVIFAEGFGGEPYNYAADLASRLMHGFDDWFLPSIGELMVMYENLPPAVLENFATQYAYWSSSEGNAYEDSVQVVYFAGTTAGESRYLQKFGNGYVRAIRAF